MPIGGIEFHKVSTNSWVAAAERDPADEDGLRLRGAGNDPSGYLTILYADIPGGSWNANRLAKFAEIANQRLTYRIPLAALPADDPDKTIDPNDYPRLYWEGGDLCSRAVTVSDVTFVNGQLNFTVSRAF